MNIYAVRQALAAAAASVVGLNCFGYEPESIPEPCFYAGEVAIEPDQTFGAGMDQVFVTCRLLVSRGDDRAGQLALDGYLRRRGSGSVRAALMAARGAPGAYALGGACDDFHIQRIDGYRLYLVGEASFYGAEIRVRVIGDGNQD